MIVVDTSAVIAILWGEVGNDRYLSAIEASERLLIAAPNALELYLVTTGRFGASGGEKALCSLDEMKIEIAPFTPALVAIAADASLRFGKGRHKASLNFGDCMAYALAKSLDAPLLYKGNDFGLTDIRAAV